MNTMVLSRLLPLVTTTLIGVVAVVQAKHGSLDPSSCEYRVPYADGEIVSVGFDHHTHASKDAYDLNAASGSGAVLVAAASGIIRGVMDRHGNNDNRGDGRNAADTGPIDDDNLEDFCTNDTIVAPFATTPGEGDQCQDYNNYVWVEHPNGEFTKYSHVWTLSSSQDYEWKVGDVIYKGQPVGLQGTAGFSFGPHLHWEVAIPSNLASPFSTLGGFVSGGPNARKAASMCPTTCTDCFTAGDDNSDGFMTANNPEGDSDGPPFTTQETYTAGPCTNRAPEAVIDNGASIQLNEGDDPVVLIGSSSFDIDCDLLSYAWSPVHAWLNATDVANVEFDPIDGPFDTTFLLTVSDFLPPGGGDISMENALDDTAQIDVEVLNVAPSVTASPTNGVFILDEGQTIEVTASFIDPGVLDKHVGTIDWGDGSPIQDLGTVLAGAPIVESHPYGDNGAFDIEVTITDSDEAAGSVLFAIIVQNVNPVASIDLGEQRSFPGGDYFVLEPNQAYSMEATASDAGSDDLTFDWGFAAPADTTTYFNNGISTDPIPSPLGTYPFQAMDVETAEFAASGIEILGLTVTDDDGGTTTEQTVAIVLGSADETRGDGWWKHQYSGNGFPQITPDLAEAYLGVVNVVSSIFSEEVDLFDANDAVSVLSANASDARAMATRNLLAAWFHFCSGAVAYDAPVNDTFTYIQVMFFAEAAILDVDATNQELKDVSKLLKETRHAL